MAKRLRAITQTEVNSVSGPSNYSQGTGTPADEFTTRSDLDRVDEVTAGVNNGSYNAQVLSVTSNNRVHIGVFSADTGNAVSDDTDLSSESFTYTAYKL